MAGRCDYGKEQKRLENLMEEILSDNESLFDNDLSEYNNKR